jgi:hypothetical protein
VAPTEYAIPRLTEPEIVRQAMHSKHDCCPRCGATQLDSELEKIDHIGWEGALSCGACTWGAKYLFTPKYIKNARKTLKENWVRQHFEPADPRAGDAWRVAIRGISIHGDETVTQSLNRAVREGALVPLKEAGP